MNAEFRAYSQRAQLFIVLSVLLGLVVAGLTLVQMVLLSRAVARVFLARAQLEQVRSLLGLLLAVVVVRALAVWVREVVSHRGASILKGKLRAKLFDHIMRLGPTYTRGERTGELVAAATEGVERLDPYVARYLPQTALSVLVPLLIAGYVLTLDITSGILLLVTAPVIPVLMVLVGSYAEGHMRRQWLALSRMSAQFLDSLQGLTTTRLFGREAAALERVALVSEEFRRRTLKVLRYAFLSGLVLEFMTTMAIALLAVTLGVRLVSRGIPFERALLILLLTPEFYRPLRELGTHRHAAMEGKAALARVSEVLAVAAPPTAQRPGTWAGRSVRLELSELSYTYPNASGKALSSVSLRLEPGTCTAVVGRSGAGKSTLVGVLMCFLSEYEGHVTANGRELREIDPEEWREQVALVPQRPYLFHGTVRDNLLLARPEATFREVEEAVRLAGAEEFIDQLPLGYDTPLGERGARLSSGQAQRIAIARAFLKDAPVLLLDEPTSSLDSESEGVIRDALHELMDGRTVLVAAHRLNTVRDADRVVVLESGRVAETGTHEELLAAGGAYSLLVGAYRGVAA